MSAEPAIVLPQGSKTTRKKKTTFSTVRKTQETANMHFPVPREVRKRIKQACAANEMSRTRVLTALVMHQIDEHGYFRFPLDEDDR